MAEAQKQRYFATVGTFDGVHRGHVYLLEQLKRLGKELGLTPLVIVLSPHPLAVLRPEAAPPILTAPEERMQLIRCLCGIDDVLIQSLSRHDYAFTARDFFKLLHEKYGVDALLMGFNNHIGSDRATAATLAAEGLPVYEAKPLNGASTPVPEGAEGAPAPEKTACASSSAIRRALVEGDIATASALLGRPFSLKGKVVGGKKIGRTIGFPTANIMPTTPSQLIPARGVYAVDVTVEGHTYRGMANIGTRPTVAGAGAEQTIEVHIIDFEGNIYGKEIIVAFLARLRDERRFDTLDALSAQLNADRLAALSLK